MCRSCAPSDGGADAHEQNGWALFRCVDVVMELFAMAAALARARHMVDDRDPDAARALGLAYLFYRTARPKVRRLFLNLWSNEDARKNRVAASVMRGEQVWLR